VAAVFLVFSAGEVWFQQEARRERRTLAEGKRLKDRLLARVDKPNALYDFDSDLGMVPIPNARASTSTKHDGKPYYEVVYSIDSDGLRVSPPSDGATDSLVFLGGSFTFGLGVEDDQTMPWIVGEQTEGRYRIFNFGVSTYGAQQMLAALRSGRVESSVDPPPRYVFFLWIGNHVRRSKCLEPWTIGAPRFVLDDSGRVRRRGNFGDGTDEESTEVRSLAFRVASRSAVFSAIYGGTIGYSKNAALVAAMVGESRDRVQRIWPEARFRVIFWDDPGSWKHAVMRAKFEAEGLSMIRIGDMLPGFFADEDSFWLHPTDRHPNAESYRKMADYLVREVGNPSD